MDNNLDKVVYLRVDDIIPNRFQPREIFDETGLEELADSIKEHGVIQPIIVRQVGDKYELIAGERRTKASTLAGLTTIPAIIKNMDDKESAKVSLLENLQRKNLSAIEEARTYKRILELDNMTQEDLAKTMGKSQPLVANKLRLLSLPEEVQDALMKNQISERHARSLLNIKDKEIQLNLLNRIRNERLTVRELDNEIKKIREQGNNFNENFESNQHINNNMFDNGTSNNIYNNTSNNFNNMGLNDYRSQFNGNMFGNIPTNDFQNESTQPYQNFNNQFNQNEFNFGNFNDNNDFQMKTNNNLENNFNNNYSSFGEMLDKPNENIVNRNVPEDNENLSNLFVSQIKENETQKAGNQFLPNFDDFGLNPNNETTNFNNESINNDFGSNFTTNNLDNDFNNSNELNNNFEYPTNNYSGFDVNNNITNQGELFNQPLNIVSVPENDLNYSENIDYTSNNMYEDILNTKPVPVEPINNDFNDNAYEKDEYIRLEPEITIFNTRDAVLELKKTTDRIKQNKINIDTEEIDYDDYYQIIIKIKKGFDD